MLYCERCQTLYDEQCPFCHKHDGREVQNDDLCFVTEQGDLWAGVLEDVFRQAGIPCMRRQAVGVASYVGVNLARYRFYTPFHRLEEAMELCADVLTPADEIEAEDGDAPDEV